VFLLTLRQLSGKWRLTILFVLASLPIVIAALLVSFPGAPSVEEFEDGVLGGMLAGAISPLVVLAIASAAFGNEVEDQTLANLTLAPIPRWQIVVPKLLAAVCVAGPFIAVSAYSTGYIAFSADAKTAAAVAAAAVVGVALYSSAFLWLGLKTTRAIGYGLLRYYSIAWMHGFDARRFAEADLSFGFAAGASVVVFAGFLLLAIRRLRHMDVP
jgi:ABC-2 type transport system permease protein